MTILLLHAAKSAEVRALMIKLTNSQPAKSSLDSIVCNQGQESRRKLHVKLPPGDGKAQQSEDAGCKADDVQASAQARRLMRKLPCEQD